MNVLYSMALREIKSNGVFAQPPEKVKFYPKGLLD